MPVPAGTSNEKPLPSVETSAPSGSGGGPPLCCSPARTPLADPVGAPFDQLKDQGPSNCPIPRRGAVGAGSMFVRLLIADPPLFRTSGASEVLVPPPAKPQIAQSSAPTF